MLIYKYIMRAFLIIFLTLSLTACYPTLDAIKRARTQNIMVVTPHADGAKCTITDAIGRKWRVRNTPNSVNVQEGHSPLKFVCRKTGYKTTVNTISEHKQELLTIDGERVTLGIYQQFPTKSPRLIPSLVKETAGFAIDPTGNLSTKYPNEVTIWMEPNEFESDEAMIAWAYDKEIWINERILQEDDDKAKDDARKKVRRDLKQARKEKRKEYLDKAFEFSKKVAVEGTKPINYVKVTEKVVKHVVGEVDEATRYAAKASEGGAIYTINTADEILAYSVDKTGDGARRLANSANDGFEYAFSELRDDAAYVLEKTTKTTADTMTTVIFNRNLEELKNATMKFRTKWIKEHNPKLTPKQRYRIKQTSWYPEWKKRNYSVDGFPWKD